MYKNPEGYADPTAGEAIRKASRKERRKKNEQEKGNIQRNNKSRRHIKHKDSTRHCSEN